MFRRRSMVGRRGPGVVGTVARTALIAGTATAVAGAVSGSRQSSQGAPPTTTDATDLEQVKAQVADLQAQQTDSAVAAAGSGQQPAGPEMLSLLERLVKLREQGALSDEEFARAKARILDAS